MVGGDLAPRPVAGHAGAQIGEAESTLRPCRTKSLTRRLLIEGLDAWVAGPTVVHDERDVRERAECAAGRANE